MVPLMKPGTFFRISNYLKSNVHLPESIGVISHILPRGGINWGASVLMTRRGKKGVKRLERVTLNVPVIKLNNKEVTNAYRGCMCEMVYLEPLPYHIDLIHELSDIEFVAWANAYTWYLLYVSSTLENSMWHTSSSSEMRTALNSNMDFDPDNEMASYYSTAGKYELIETVRREEVKMIKHILVNQRNIYQHLSGVLGKNAIFGACNTKEKSLIKYHIVNSNKAASRINDNMGV